MNYQHINRNAEELHRLIGARLRHIRLEKRISLKQLARRSRVSIHTLDLLECGRGDIRLQTVARITSALDIPPCDLLISTTTHSHNSPPC